MKEENRRIEDEKLVEKKLSKGMKVEIDTKKEGTRLTNPERQMKQENRFPWENHRFSEDSRRTGRHTCQRKSIQFSYMALFKVSGKKSKTFARRQDEGTIY